MAARSGTGKQTIYRWWPSKADVLMDAMAIKAGLFIPIPDTGRYAADLRAFLGAGLAPARRPARSHSRGADRPRVRRTRPRVVPTAAPRGARRCPEPRRVPRMRPAVGGVEENPSPMTGEVRGAAVAGSRAGRWEAVISGCGSRR
nr:hypothetical protein [Nonomuraea sp. PA05]